MTDQPISDQTMPDQRWLMRVESGLAAHFKQENGPSRPGTLWTVGIKHGDEQYHAMVKGLLADDATAATRKDEKYQAQTAMQYLDERIGQGWHPSQMEEHTIYISNPKVARGGAVETPRPWWRFW
jgi:hypothetical protein